MKTRQEAVREDIKSFVQKQQNEQVSTNGQRKSRRQQSANSMTSRWTHSDRH